MDNKKCMNNEKKEETKCSSTKKCETSAKPEPAKKEAKKK